jgi:Lsr2
MATKITVALEDDLGGGPANETVQFGLGSAQYEIDLNKKNARAFRKKLTPFVEHARKAGPGQRRPPARTPSSRQHSADIRAWAKATGLPVSDRGRIPASVVDQYEATTKRPLRSPGHRRHKPIRSDRPWPASQPASC